MSATTRKSWMLGTGTKPESSRSSAIELKCLNKQPVFPINIDWSNSLLENAKLVITHTDKPVAYTIYSGTLKNNSNNNLIVNTIYGKGLKGPTSSDPTTLPSAYSIPMYRAANEPYAIYALYIPANTTDINAGISVECLSAASWDITNLARGFGQNGSNIDFYHRRLTRFSATSVIVPGKPMVICLTGDVSCYGYINGTYINTYSNGVETSVIKHVGGGYQYGCQGAVVMSLDYNGVHSEARVKEISKALLENPWQIFKKPKQIKYFDYKAKTQDSYPVTRTVSSPAPSLILPKKTMQQPQGPVEIDHKNSLTRDIAFALLFNGQNPKELVYNTAITNYGGYFNIATNRLSAYTVPSSVGSYYMEVAHRDEFNLINGMTILTSVVRNSTFNISKTQNNGATNNPFDFGMSGDYLYFVRANTNYEAIRSSQTIPLSGTFGISVDSGYLLDGANCVFYSNGERLSNTIISASGSGLVTGNVYPIRISRRWDVSGNNPASYNFIIGWKRALSPLEHIEFYRNPWQVFKPIKRRIITGV